MKNVTGRALRPKGNYPKQPKVWKIKKNFLDWLGSNVLLKIF